ncbi:hypothetical protein GJ496_004336 [Pomphorhynchus laevis]|nr:hypothetical protein GJ496_004336 [Pomphorhynchus laevis]
MSNILKCQSSVYPLILRKHKIRRLRALSAYIPEVDSLISKLSLEINDIRALILSKENTQLVLKRKLKSEDVVPKKASYGDSIEDLLSIQSVLESEHQLAQKEITDLLNGSTAKERFLYERFRIDRDIYEFCEFGTVDECITSSSENKRCHKVHFRKIIHSHTDVSLGDCSFLNTCFHMDTCKYIHYEIDKSNIQTDQRTHDTGIVAQLLEKSIPPQWVQCDLRAFDITVLGKFSIVMADPPWDIHMELPYGTMADTEMRKLNIPCLQDEGYIFLWVTGRAMELGRECLNIWGYKRIDELVWVKTNQLQRIIRTGRTGHWLNHGKEHCLIGVKGDISKGKFNRGLDCDVIVSEVRETSRKPDEIYGICERLSPGTRKIELFGRPHNVQSNWTTLGNQLEGIRLVEPDVVQRFRARYPTIQV